MNDIRKAEARYRRAIRHADDLRNERDEVIRAAIANGMTHAQVHQALNGSITRARIGQIAIEPQPAHTRKPAGE